VKFAISSKLSIIDAIWHNKDRDDCIVCLTNDYYLRYFNVKNPKIQFKEYYLANVHTQTNLEQLNNDKTGTNNKNNL